MTDQASADNELGGLRPLPPSALRAVDQVYGALRDSLANGAVRPGTRLLEIQVAAQLGVSRTPVREALRRLEAEGLARRHPDRGLVFADITPHDVADLGQIRTELDTLAARLAAANASPDSWDPAEQALDELERSLRSRQGRAQKVRDAHRGFHLAVYQLAFTPLVSAFLSSNLLQFLEVSTRLHAPPGSDDSAGADHRALLAALRSGDPEAAARAARFHASRGAEEAHTSVASRRARQQAPARRRRAADSAGGEPRRSEATETCGHP